MRKPKLLHVILLWCCFFAHAVYAAGTRTSVFYPLPSLSQGKVFATKQLFVAEHGGIWIHDVHGDIYFFDGSNILPSRGSIFPQSYDHLTYAKGHFWTFVDHQLIKLTPNQRQIVETQITPGQQIRVLGVVNDWLWFADDNDFYTYEIESGVLKRYSLQSVYRQSESSQVYVTDAEKVGDKWVLATSSGVYVSNQNSFQHIPVSGKRYIEKLHYSQRKQEMVVGTLNGALVFGIEKQTKMPRYIGNTHVLSIAETDNGYWVGTENGLFVYNSISGEINQLQSSQLSDYNLVGDKVYALVNDQQGGVWVGSDRGVRYHSLFSRNFDRLSANEVSVLSRGEKILYFAASEQSEGYWLATSGGLYRFRLNNFKSPSLIYRGKVLDVAQYQHELWLATPKGIVRFDLLTNEETKQRLPNDVSAPTAIEVGTGNTLWGVSGLNLWRYELDSGAFQTLGEDWWIGHYLPARVTELKTYGKDSVLIGTDHGLYVLNNNRVRFIQRSANFGEVIDIERYDDKVWVAASYGVYHINLETSEFEVLETVSPGIGPRCLVASKQGVWLSSSMGLSFYSPSAQLTQHFSSPFGTINNEFLADICLNDQSDADYLVFGTRSGLLSFDSRTLMHAERPPTAMIFSQVDVNSQPIHIGGVAQSNIAIDFGDSISFRVGTSPSDTGSHKFYRLRSDSEWTPLEGRQITFDRLGPGKHTLEVKLQSRFGEQLSANTLTFSVNKPWYLKPISLALFVLFAIALVIGLIAWRSRRVMFANRKLRAQVALKTSQLKHQSRTVLNNNKSLRKQIEVREQLLTRLSADACSDKDNLLMSFKWDQHELLMRLSSQHCVYEPVAFDLLPVSKAVVECWQMEFNEKGVALELSSDEASQYGLVQQLNLDSVLNTVLAASLRRLTKGETLSISWRSDDCSIYLSIQDYGRQLPNFAFDGHKGSSSMLSFESLPHHAALSGAQLSRHSSPQENRLILEWERAECHVQADVSKSNNLLLNQPPISQDLEKTTRHISDQEAWLHRVDALIEDNYADAQFSTSVASKALFTSERSLQRKFKAITGKTFTEALIEVRLENACEKLLGGQRISDVAFDCGFNDHSYFSQRFKLHYGLSPSQFVDAQTELSETI